MGYWIGMRGKQSVGMEMTSMEGDWGKEYKIEE